MPTTILIISDMEFDSAVSDGMTAYQSIKHRWSQAGYTLPDVVFWNVNAKTSNFPVKFDEVGTAMISGFSPSILKQLLSDGQITPEAIMRSVLDSERYSPIEI